jgi:Sigma-70 region 2
LSGAVIRGATLGAVPDIGSLMSENDTRGFGLLFDEHRRAVLAYALRRVDDPADAADVLAETFLVAWRRLDEVPAGAGAKPWLLAVARRVLSNQRRGARRRIGLADRLAQELSAYRPPVPTESDLLVRRALAGLSDADESSGTRIVASVRADIARTSTVARHDRECPVVDQRHFDTGRRALARRPEMRAS